MHFVALPDGTLVVEEDEPDDALAPLADAVEASISPPYRAEAVRRGAGRLGGRRARIEVVAVPGLEATRRELVVHAATDAR